MSTVVRHRVAPNPYGCRWCGHDQGNHSRRYVRSVGMHAWKQPTRAQILARMTARRNARKDAR